MTNEDPYQPLPALKTAKLTIRSSEDKALIEQLQAQNAALSLRVEELTEALEIVTELGCQFDLDGSCEDFLEIKGFCHVCRCQAALAKPAPEPDKIAGYPDRIAAVVKAAVKHINKNANWAEVRIAVEALEGEAK